MKDIVLIPAYKPNEQLIDVVTKLSEHQVGILVVDDGSGSEYAEVFNKVEEMADVFHIPYNGGKGTALKNGMTVIKEQYPDCEYFVTADADGQHKCEDILRVFEELHRGSDFVLTIREFKNDMPKRSRFGNNLSRCIYTVLNNHYLKDNQSGLRGFGRKHIDWLLRVEGNKYDYEINVIYFADKQNITITTMPIEAIYINENTDSHFNPVMDTLRIYTRLFSSARATFISIAMVEIFLTVITIFFNYELLHITVPVAGAISAMTTILLNYFIVFRYFRYRELARVIIYTVARYLIYTSLLFAARLFTPYIPMVVMFNIIAIHLLPATYYLHKLLHLAKYNDINKTR